jgi:isopentenyldiphosphate isomerase
MYKYRFDEDDELLEVVDYEGRIIGVAKRGEIHGNPSLVHRVVHVLVFNKKGELLLQKRSINKDVAPGKWDTSVGGHVGIGEDLLTASKREMFEELGINKGDPEYLYKYIHTNSYETELVYTFRYFYDGKIYYNKKEIEIVRFWKFQDIKESIGKGLLSDNFETEFVRYNNFINHIP